MIFRRIACALHWRPLLKGASVICTANGLKNHPDTFFAPTPGANETPFVIHRHVKGGASHFDLMIRRGDKLATWSFPHMPGDVEIRGARLFDHRLRYLTFEGDIGRGKGTTTIVERGVCNVAQWSDDRIEVAFHGATFAGRYALVRIGEEDWGLAPRH